MCAGARDLDAGNRKVLGRAGRIHGLDQHHRRRDAPSEDVEPRLLLVHYLRTTLGRTGTVIGCDTSNCGACTVLLDGLSVKSCTVLAVQADGAEITTVQGLADGELHPVQKAFQGEPRAPVRLLHRRHDHVRGRPADGQPRSHRAARYGTGSRATSAGAPATTTSSRRCERPPPSCAPKRQPAQPCRSARAPPTDTARRTPHAGLRHLGIRRDGAAISPGRARSTVMNTQSATQATASSGSRCAAKRTRGSSRARPGGPTTSPVPGLLHMAIARSPMAHARITRADVSAALRAARRRGRVHRRATWPGNTARCPRRGTSATTSSSPITGRSRPTRCDTSATRWPSWSPKSAYQAADALEAVHVEYEHLPPVMDMVAALDRRSAARAR